MAQSFRVVILFLSLVHIITANYGTFESKTDREYNVIKFKVPNNLWQQALKPTPVLKSSVTMTVPIHVDSDVIDEENEVDEIQNDDTDVNVVVDNTLVTDAPLQDPVVTDASISNVTEQVVQDEVTEAPPADVPGQVVRFPCTCIDGQCGCCTGAILDRFRTKVCGNISFVPEDFVFDVRLTVNNNTVVRRRVSASDPPPICFNPRRAPFVRVCVEISNIRIRNRNAFACLDINADIAGFTVYSASFRCFGLGSSGVQTGLKPKPVSSGPKPVNLFGNGNNNNNNNGPGTILDAAGAILGNGAETEIFGDLGF